MQTLSLFEAECLVSKLRVIGIEKIGTCQWMSQHESFEKLNIQCHASAQSKHDEYVVNEIITQDKLSAVIYNMVTLEIWKEKVFPLVVDKINGELSLKTYMILYEEATLATMLQILLYHSSSMEVGTSDDSDDSALLELVDYCHRKLVSVASKKVKAEHFNCHLSEIEPNPSKKLIKQRKHLEFMICSCCVSLIRFITDHLSKSSISVMERVLNTHQMIMVLIELIEHNPWTKRAKNGSLEKFGTNNKFVAVDKNDRLRLSKIEGELWLSVYNILMDKTCANKYELNTYRRGQILRLKKHLFPQIIEQLPVLKGLKRTLEELSIMNLNDSSSSSSIGGGGKNERLRFVVEIVPEFREELLEKDFERIAKDQMESIFNVKEYGTKQRQKDMEILCRIYNNFDGLEDMLDPPTCAQCGRDAQQRCSRCKSEWYCSRDCQLKSWKKHKTICNTIAKNRTKIDDDDNKKYDESSVYIKEVMSKNLR